MVGRAVLGEPLFVKSGCASLGNLSRIARPPTSLKRGFFAFRNFSRGVLSSLDSIQTPVFIGL